MPTITLTTDASNGARVAAAVGAVHGYTNGGGNPRSATAQEVTAHVMQYLKNFTLSYERRVAQAAADESITEITVT